MILGQFAGGPAVRTDYNQTDPSKADYLVGRENIAPMSHAEDKNNPHGVTIAEIGAAPSGYGLGGVSRDTTDWNNEKLNGWYRDAGKAANSPFPNSFTVGFVTNYVDDCIQNVYSRTGKTLGNYVLHAMRVFNADAEEWGEWEYVNPVMADGKEYRTTERYNNKPVYARLYTYPGVTPNGYGEVLHGIADIKEIVRANGVAYDSAGVNGKIIGTVGNTGMLLEGTSAVSFVEVSNKYVAIHAGGNMVGKTLKVAMYYTKTTN